VKILLAQIIPAKPGGHDLTTVPLLNARLPGLALRKTLPRSPVLTVDLYTGFNADSMTHEGIHPNEAGEKLIAARFLAGYERIIKPTALVYLPGVKK
jgi:lysophospholipase L1-like esterase